MEEIKKIKFKGYKSFKDENVVCLGETVTLFIGKNNSGKSSSIDVIEAAVNPDAHFRIKDTIESLEIAFEVSEYAIKRVFYKTNSHSGFSGNDYEFGKTLIGSEVFISYSFLKSMGVNSNSKLIRAVSVSDGQGKLWDKVRSTWRSFVDVYTNYERNYCFRRINAERDIIPEPENNSKDVSSSGNGATNLIRLFVNNSIYDEALVEKKILEELNSIMYPEAFFESIRVQQVQQNDENIVWEIFLKEKEIGRVALSKSGSGLKTILLTLVNLYLIPELDENKGKRMIFAFEELENNLHPALQRRLFDYLFKYAEDTGNRIVLTTHSHIAINCFFGKNEAKLYHVVKNNGNSSFTVIENYVDKIEILDDLDVKASDLLQANGIIWVEGPSDRIYIKRWLSIFCNCEYIEGRDYQFLYYGGRLLSHYTANDTALEGLINVLTTNRHAAIVMDSDKRSRNASINATKKRVRDEFEKNNCFCWITKGKEIENYLPCKGIENKYNTKISQIKQYALFPKYIEKCDKTFESHKVDFAKGICEYITAENSDIMDLKQSIKKLYKEIESWNSK